MSGKEKAYFDVTAQADPNMDIATTADKEPMTKAEEARAESSRSGADESAPLPAYTERSTESRDPIPSQTLPLPDDVRADMQSLSVGDPKEVISVPMIHSTETVNFKKLLSKNRKTITRTVVVRRMQREQYLKHYAKDAEGNYVGTEKPAVDAGLVFVPSKSTPEDILQQVRKVAFGKEHYGSDFSAGMTQMPSLC